MPLMIPAGSVQLEAHLREPRGTLRGAAVFCHPHPVYGGTMDNRVVYRAAKSAAAAGFAALRFNFRGAGNSTGSFDQGIGERDDVAAALGWLEGRYPGRFMALGGYSFGAWVGLQIGCEDRRIRALLGLGLPLNLYSMDFLADCSKPALYIVGTRDEFCSPENLDRLSQRLPATSRVRRIAGADHFFNGHIEAVERLMAEFFEERQTDQDTA
jgi:alpha/beta superfamily hydrolase